MKKLVAVALALYGSTVLAASPTVLSQVNLQLKANRWVNVDSVKVSVSVHAVLNDEQATKAYADILKKLATIAKGEWHIISFNKSETSSHLNKIDVQATVRLPLNAVNALQSNAKLVSKPGEAFSVSSVDYTPSAAAFEHANIALRTAIYDQARAEAKRLNKVYAGSHYRVSNIDFVPYALPTPLANTMVAMAKVGNAENNVTTPTAMMSQHLTIHANVTFQDQQISQN